MLHDYNLNALIVDDSATMRQGMRQQLMQIGVMTMSEAPNAAIALDKLRNGKFDLLILDYYLGDATDGQQLLERIRTERLVPSSAVVLMVTAERNYEGVAKVAEHAPDAYLLKPFKTDELLKRLQPLVERKLGLRRPNTPGIRPLLDLFDADEYDKALLIARALVQKEGLKQDIARLIGEILLAQGNYPAAIEHYTQLASQPWAKLGLARTYKASGQVEQAVQELNDLVAAVPSYYPAVDVLAECHDNLGDHGQALKVLSEACAKSPTIFRMRAAGSLAEKLGRHEEVAKWFGKVVEDNKFALQKNPADYARCASGLAGMGQMDKALAFLNATQKDLPPDLRGDPSLVAAKVVALGKQLEVDTQALEAMPPEMRERREALLVDKRKTYEGLLEKLQGIQTNPETVAVASEALSISGRGDELSRVQTLHGLHLLREGKASEALGLYETMAERTDCSAATLANLVMAAVAVLKQGGQRQAAQRGEAALGRLRAQFPDYPRLQAVEHAWKQSHTVAAVSS